MPLTFDQNIGGWNISNVTNISSMFSGASSFNQDISGWDTSSITNMRGLFSNTNNFDQDIGSWNTSSVTDYEIYVFGMLEVFNQDIGSMEHL